MKLDEQEQKRGATWFFIVGPIGFLVVLFLAKADLYLTYTDAEDQKNAKMHELRLAQTSLTTVTLDERNAGNRSYRASKKNKMDEATESDKPHGAAHH